MSSLLDLPDEILLEVVSWLEYEKPTLCNLARINSRLSSLVPRVLARSISLVQDFDDRHQIETFFESIQRNPSLARSVYDAAFNWRTPDSSGTYDRLSQSRISDILGQLSSLRTLSLKQGLFERIDFPLDFLGYNRLDFLTDISLHTPGLTSDNVIKLLSLRQIKQLSIDRVSHWNIPTIPVELTETSTLKSLEFGISCPIPGDVLRIFLERATRLTYLTCMIPGTVADYFETNIYRCIMNGPTSSRNTLNAIYPARHSLKILVISSGSEKFRGHDRSRLDLRDFKVLELLSLTSAFVFPKKQAHIRRDGLHMLLPRALKSLTIQFRYGDGIDTGCQSTTVTMAGGDAAKFNWLSQIATHHATRLPYLSYVRLDEVIFGVTWERLKFTQASFPIPEDISEAFRSNNISLCARMRVLKLSHLQEIEL